VNDPICAQITAPGISAIAVIRISGTNALKIVADFFDHPERLAAAASHSVIFGTFLDQDKVPIDEVLITIFRAPHSYTGEDVAEISCHGNPQLSQSILATLLGKARPANPGEFSLRAYLNGKMNLSQAEAVNDLIHSGSSKAAMAALMQVKGYLSRHLEELLEEISDARLRCELAIDFADQDLPQIDLDALRLQIEAILKKAKDLHEEGTYARRLREGIKICLAGAPNAGKSSLFNAFLKQNRAIVTAHPGTTRDYLEESFSLAGYPIVLYDTAGIRNSSDIVEQEGIARSHQLMQEADIILYLLEDEQIPREALLMPEKTILVASKADLRPNTILPESFVAASSVSPHGLKQLSERILAQLKLPNAILERPLVTNVRHLAALAKCTQALQDALQALAMDAGFEFIAGDLIRASSALEDILGVVPTDALLHRIFDNFCIGK
jgi:tRNA modification GTPase